jgi:hypothetical protein
MTDITYRERTQEPVWGSIEPQREEVVCKDNPAHSHRRGEYVYYNYTGVPLIIVDRDGEETLIEPSPAPEIGNGIYAKPIFKVVKVKYYSLSALNKARFPGSEGMEGKLGEITKAYHSRVLEERNRTGGMAGNTIKSIRYEYRTDLETIREADGAMYFEQIDLVIRTQESATVYHPQSPVGRYHEMLVASRKKVRKPVAGITIVDNDGMIGTRWIRMIGKIFKVEPTHVPGAADGVYIDGHCEAVHAGGSARRVLPDTIKHYPPGDPRIESLLGLYLTEREAILCMCEKDIIARELRIEEEEEKSRRAEKQAEFDREARDHALRMREKDIAMANAKETINEKQAQRAAERDEREAVTLAAKAAAELENQNMKKQYEQDSHTLAVQREWLKFVTPVIGMLTVIISTVATIMQLRKSSGLFKLLA